MNSPLAKAVSFTTFWRFTSQAAALGFMVSLGCSPSLADVPPANSDTVEEAALPLPRWSEQELKTFRNTLPGLGGILPEADDALPEVPETLSSPFSLGPKLEASPPPDGSILPRLRPEDMRLFLPESLLNQPNSPQQFSSPPAPNSLSTLKEVPPEFLAVASRALANEYLIDPGTVLTEMQQQDIYRFLEFHAHEARIKLHVLVLAGDRKLPTDANLDSVCSNSLAKGRACLLVYPLGEPWRARLFLSQAVYEKTSADFLKETVQSCVKEALQSSETHDQLHNYCVELSTRLFWLQRALGDSATPSSAQSQPLTEISGERQSMASPATAARLHSPFILGIGASALLAVLIARPTVRRLKRWRTQRLQNRVWLLPEVETIPRLGGAFTGGGGVLMRYGHEKS